MQKLVLVCGLACGGAAHSVAAAGIADRPIFGEGASRTAKAEKQVAQADALADAEEGDTLSDGEWKKVKVKHFQAKLAARSQAIDLLNEEGLKAAEAKDKEGLAAIVAVKKKWGLQMDDLKARLKAESGEVAAIAPEAGAKPGDPAAAPAKGPAKAPSADADLPPFHIAAGEIPSLMLGKWKRVEDGQVRCYYILKSDGSVHTFKMLKADGTPSRTVGTWQVWTSGDISFVNDDDGGNDMVRVNLVAETRACGIHRLRQSDAEPYRPGSKVELVRDGK